MRTKLRIVFVLSFSLCFLNFDLTGSCIKTDQPDESNVSCINLLTDIKDLKNETITICSDMAKSEKWVGYLCLCRINTLKKNFSTAQAACFKAKEKNPFSPHIYTEIANLYISMGKNDEALTESEFALNLSTGDFNANFISAKLLETKKPEVALKLYKRALETAEKSNSIYVFGKKSLIEERIKNLEKEIKSLEKKKKETEYSNCVSRYKAEKDKEKALQTLERCLKLNKTNDPVLNFEYIELLYSNSRYGETIKNKSLIIENNLKEGQKERFYFILADSYEKTGDIKKALTYYSKIYQTTNDPKILKKYAEALEKDNNKIIAVEVYSKLYSIAPNKNLYEKIETLKLESMSSEEILSDMKSRGFIEKEKVVLSPEDKKLYYSVRLSERKGAVEWVNSSYPGYANITLKNSKGEYVLMRDGYNLYLKYVSQQAIKHLQKNKVIPNFLFKLRDENGDMIFDQKGRLTYEGLKAYYKAVETNQKTWYYSTEVPKKDLELKTSYENKEKKEKALQEEKKLAKAGYEEIAETEYLWLMKVTTCPEEVLLNPPCNLKKLDYGDSVKYFICSKNEISCGSTPMTLFSYIVSYRAGNTDVIDTKQSTAFFGTGAVKKHRFCEDGKIWTGK